MASPCAPGTRTIRMCSFDGRSWDWPRHPLMREWKMGKKLLSRNTRVKGLLVTLLRE